ncbi:FUSC family protein, partial [Acinetobacter baumannii]|nr:FUSC family protein [Acinetobacter baumannii]
MKGLPRFPRPELLFSAKCFAAASLALYLASSAGLPRPFWALMTTYIVAHPLASNVRSKALFRLIGTLLGCAAAIVLIPPLSGAPELLSLALALWTGLCLYLSLLDRSARSYV